MSKIRPDFRALFDMTRRLPQTTPNLRIFFSQASKKRANVKSLVIKGEDIYLSVNLTFEEAVRGIEKQIIVKKKTICGDCEGNKCLKGTLPKKCWTCYGKGIEVIKTGPYLEENACKKCDGSGMTIIHKCPLCKGHGVLLTNWLDTLRIPQFIEDGEMLRFEHHGHFAAHSYPGDLFLTVFVDPHPTFSRVGIDLIITLYVSYSFAVLGGKISVPKLNGENQETNFPPLFHDSTFTIENEGLLDRKSGKRGNKTLIFKIKNDSHITQAERELYTKLKIIGL